MIEPIDVLEAMENLAICYGRKEFASEKTASVWHPFLQDLTLEQLKRGVTVNYGEFMPTVHKFRDGCLGYFGVNFEKVFADAMNNYVSRNSGQPFYFKDPACFWAIARNMPMIREKDIKAGAAIFERSFKKFKDSGCPPVPVIESNAPRLAAPDKQKTKEASLAEIAKLKEKFGWLRTSSEKKATNGDLSAFSGIVNR